MATRAIATGRSCTARTACAPSSARTSAAANQRIVVDRWQGKRFNAPNDIVVKSDGTIWFTDPPYGLIIPEEGHGGESEIGDCYVFRFDPRSGALDPVTELPDRARTVSPSRPTSRCSTCPIRRRALGREATGQPVHLRVRRVGGQRARRMEESSPTCRPACPTASASIATAGSTRARRTPCRCLPGRHAARQDPRAREGRQRDVRRRRPRLLYIAASTSLYRIRLATQGISAARRNRPRPDFRCNGYVPISRSGESVRLEPAREQVALARAAQAVLARARRPRSPARVSLPRCVPRSTTRCRGRSATAARRSSSSRRMIITPRPRGTSRISSSANTSSLPFAVSAAT